MMQVVKRNGEQHTFELEKIVNAIRKAMETCKIKDDVNEQSHLIASRVRHRLANNITIDIEQIQDLVEDELMSSKYHEVAKAYILYRNQHQKLREEKGISSTKLINRVTPKIQELADASSARFNYDPLREAVYMRTYSRWIPDQNRREFWKETVQRYVGFIREKCGNLLLDKDYETIYDSVFNMDVMPSMRLLQFAGPAANRCNVCIYNCAFSAPTSFKDLADIMYLSMSGTGVGFTVEKSNVDKFPEFVPNEIPYLTYSYDIQDSKEGWCNALQYCLEKSFEGAIVNFNYSLLRPQGARCITSGGRSSGPEPLKELLKFIPATINTRRAQGFKTLSTLNLHDIICKIGQIVVAGGTRRSALLSMSDLNDIEMRECKNGPIWLNNDQRYLANNSAVYNTKPPQTVFMKEWLTLAESGTGERGIINRSGLRKVLPKRRVEFLGDKIDHLGLNPCSEVLLQPFQFCNLTEVVCRTDDTEESLLRKVSIAAIMGTIQSSLSDFKYIDPKWKKNQDDERLLGVSLTGIYDCPILKKEGILEKLRQRAIDSNLEYAGFLGINRSNAITCVKPSGTVSQMVNASSGIHPRFSKYYIRRVRFSSTDPLLKMMIAQGYIAKSCDPQNNSYAVEFPVKSPDDCIVVNDVSTVEQLETWKRFKMEYTEHNPSVSIYVKPNEWIDTSKWVWENWDIVVGLSFFPYSDHVYDLAPYEAITKEEYETMQKSLKKLDFAQLVNFEYEDTTDVKKEVACAGGVCEL